jgi:hypothetical protein
MEEVRGNKNPCDGKDVSWIALDEIAMGFRRTKARWMIENETRLDGAAVMEGLSISSEDIEALENI